MDIKGTYTFDAPQELVWDALRDPDVLGTVLPGGEGIEEVGENQYVGNLKIKVGPVQGKFKGNIELYDLNEPDSYSIKVDGKGAPGFVKATGSINLTGQGEQTLLDYAGKAQVGGRIASVGQRLIDTSAKSIIRQSLDGLNQYLAAKYETQKTAEAAGATQEEVQQAVKETQVDIEAPSQTQIAANVAKDVVKENSVPILALAGAAIAIIVALVLLFG